MTVVPAARTARAIACLVATAGAVGAQADNGLRVTPDKENVVASRLVGRWHVDLDLKRRLGGPDRPDALEFKSDDKVVAGIPAAIAGKLKDCRIYLAGRMTLGGKEQPFILVELHGNPHVVWFRERGGDPMGDAESFNVMMARGSDPDRDVLFVGGDFNNQAFAPYARARPGEAAASRVSVGGAGTIPAETQVRAAIADMARMLSAKLYLEFIQTYCAPDDLEKIARKGESLEQLAKQFAERKGERLLKILESIRTVTPTFNEDQSEATFEKADGDRPLRMQRIEKRWYLRN